VVRENLVIGPIKQRDIPEILELEKNTHSAWSRIHLEDELQQPAGIQFAVRNEATERVMAVLFGRIVADEAEILKVSVAASARQKGVGYDLLDFTINYGSTRGVKNFFLELRTSNEAARRLYEKRGFVCVGTRKNYYSKPVEDAVLMQLVL
jgi:ribosomal-protein-alanine N-acetyltransferase